MRIIPKAAGSLPTERKLSARLRWRITGRWPQQVVNERLDESDRKMAAAQLRVERIIAEGGTPSDILAAL